MKGYGDMDLIPGQMDSAGRSQTGKRLPLASESVSEDQNDKTEKNDHKVKRGLLCFDMPRLGVPVSAQDGFDAIQYGLFF